MAAINPFGARTTLTSGESRFVMYSLAALAREAGINLDTLPFTVRILVENLLRQVDGENVTLDDVVTVASRKNTGQEKEFPFLPFRVVLQDFTGVPCVVDLAAMRAAVARMGGDPKKINPLARADLVIDHSVMIDAFGSNLAYNTNVELEYERNTERYALLRWAQTALENFSVVPPGTGIVHQVNLEYLADVVASKDIDGERVAMPDTLVGTDSHTTMISGLGVLGWGVGGIEAEAVLLGQPMYQLPPVIVGMKLHGALPEGATATDLVLTVTQILRKHGVVGKFVEYFGPGLTLLPLADRATIANMAPEYGATTGLFPVDAETLRYLRLTGRDPRQVQLVEDYCKTNHLFRTDTAPDPTYDELLELDLSTIRPSMAGPRRPQDRLLMPESGKVFRAAYPEVFGADAKTEYETETVQRGGAAVAVQKPKAVPVTIGRTQTAVRHGSVAIAAITSCTNTSNPSVLVAAGLLAKKAVQRGLEVSPTVKTSLAPGSRVVTDYLDAAGLTPYLEALGFHTVGYGCTTCIGNSGPLLDPIDQAIGDSNLVVASVLSGNRNFEGRIHPRVKASFLASPPLVVAYALAGTVDIDLSQDPLGYDRQGEPVYLREIWPSRMEVEAELARSVTPELFRKSYEVVFAGDERWRSMPVPTGDLFTFDSTSTYIQEPPFFVDMPAEAGTLADVWNARALAVLGDSITTDHISPAGNIAVDSPAGKHLIQHEVAPKDFNSYGSRRGNHQVMMRGTFGNIRLRNALVAPREGFYTEHLTTGEQVPIYDAAMRYIEEGTPLVILAGKEYGSGSSRDWAAKGTMLLGVKVVVAESYERIHRSNLVGMGVLPCEFLPGQGVASLGLTGRESYSITGIDTVTPHKRLSVVARRDDGSEVAFEVVTRIDSNVEVEYYRHGGILPYVLRRLMAE